MARVIIIPEAQDTRNQVRMLIALAKAAGAAVIMSQCLHVRKEGVEDGSDVGAIRCVDCGATGPGAETEEGPDASCPHGADGRDCETGCVCQCHLRMVADACNDHPDGCPPTSDPDPSTSPPTG